MVRNVTRLLALVFVGLQEVPLAAPSPQDALPLMLQFVRASGVAQLLAADEQARELRARVALLAALDTSGNWPDLSSVTLEASLDDWLSPALLTAGSLKTLLQTGLAQAIEAAFVC